MKNAEPGKVKLMQITAPREWTSYCNEGLMKAKKKVARELMKKFGTDVPFPMFFHLDLCNAMHNVYQFAPNRKEALRFIKEALYVVAENFEDEK